MQQLHEDAVGCLRLAPALQDGAGPLCSRNPLAGTRRASSLQEDAVGCLLLGTEDGRLLVLDPAGTKVMYSWKAGGVPAFLTVTGVHHVCHAQDKQPLIQRLLWSSS